MSETNTTAEVMPFQYAELPLRSVAIEGEPWFVVSDAAKILGYRDASNAARLLRPHQQGYSDVSTPSGTQRMLVCNEGGVNRLIMRSNSAGAESVQDWFTDTVIPQIRRNGFYSVAPALPMSEDEIVLHALTIQGRKIKELTAKVAEDAPKVEAFDTLMESDGTYSMLAASKILGWGRNVMMRDLRRMGILQGNRLPYQRYEHHFKVIPGTYTNRKTGETVPTATTYITPGGLEFLRKKLNQAPAVSA